MLCGSSSWDVFSLVSVPEIHWLLSDLLAFPDSDDTTLSSCHQSQGAFTLVRGRGSAFPKKPCVGPNNSLRVSSHGICFNFYKRPWMCRYRLS